MEVGPLQGMSLFGFPGVAPPLAVMIHVGGSSLVLYQVRVAVQPSGFSSNRPDQPADLASGAPSPAALLYSRASMGDESGLGRKATSPFTAESPFPSGCQKSHADGSVSEPSLAFESIVSSFSAGSRPPRT